MNCSKNAQMKIQQMAFMLVAVMIFFAMVAIVYFTITILRIQDVAADLREEEAKELARQMAGTPELMFSIQSSPFSSSVDFNKAFFISQSPEYKRGFWNLDYLAIERVYPSPSHEDCNGATLDTCRYLTIIKNTNDLAGTQTAPVAIVIWDRSLKGGYGDYRFEIGRIHALAHNPNEN